MADIIERFDAEEMKMFGLDPKNELDRVEWENTTPPEGTVIDYKDDAFAFGSIATRQEVEPVIELPL